MAKLITLELDENDARMLISDIRLAATTRKAGVKFLGMIAPKLELPSGITAEARGLKLIALLTDALER